MKNIKQIWKDHKTELAIAGCMVGAVIGLIVLHKVGTKKVVDCTGKNVISWKPENNFMNLERVKTLLDLNANNAESFAIFREGPNPMDYVFITLSDKVINDAI